MLDRITAMTAATLALASVAQAQEADPIYVNVDGAAMEVTAAQAAEACDLDEATVTATAAERASGDTLDAPAVTGDVQADVAGAEPMAADGVLESDGTASTEAPAVDGEVATTRGVEDPSTTEPANDALLALAVCQVDVETAADLGIPTAAEIVTD